MKIKKSVLKTLIKESLKELNEEVYGDSTNEKYAKSVSKHLEGSTIKNNCLYWKGWEMFIYKETKGINKGFAVDYVQIEIKGKKVKNGEHWSSSGLKNSKDVANEIKRVVAGGD